MGINLDDLNNSPNPVGASLLSGNESILDNLRELSPEELKISGGGKKGGGDPLYIETPCGGFLFYVPGGKKGKGNDPIIIYEAGRGCGCSDGTGGDINIDVDVNASSEAA